MPAENTSLGRIEISPGAIATIASQAALQSYGVVGMAPRNVVDGITNTFRVTRDPRHGVEVLAAGADITINLYIVVEYGTRITAVADSIANLVRFNVEKTLGLKVGDINVHVQGLRVSNTDA